MILGIFSDLHSNMPALDAMCAAASDIDQWMALGDSVGLYPEVNEVLNWHRENDVICVQGDHEMALLSGGTLVGSFTGTESIKKQAQVLTTKNKTFVSGMPSVFDFQVDGLRICATHFISTRSHIERSKYEIDLSHLEKSYEGYDYVFFGHTHLPAVLYGRKTIFINPGSAGFPIDVEHRCSMVIFDTVQRRFDFIRFDYDTDRLIATVENCDYNQKLCDFISNGHRWN